MLLKKAFQCSFAGNLNSRLIKLSLQSGPFQRSVPGSRQSPEHCFRAFPEHLGHTEGIRERDWCLWSTYGVRSFQYTKYISSSEEDGELGVNMIPILHMKKWVCKESRSPSNVQSSGWHWGVLTPKKHCSLPRFLTSSSTGKLSPGQNWSCYEEGSREDVKWLNEGCALRVESTGLADGYGDCGNWTSSYTN